MPSITRKRQPKQPHLPYEYRSFLPCLKLTTWARLCESNTTTKLADTRTNTIYSKQYLKGFPSTLLSKKPMNLQNMIKLVRFYKTSTVGNVAACAIGSSHARLRTAYIHLFHRFVCTLVLMADLARREQLPVCALGSFADNQPINSLLKLKNTTKLNTAQVDVVNKNINAYCKWAAAEHYPRSNQTKSSRKRRK